MSVVSNHFRNYLDDPNSKQGIEAKQFFRDLLQAQYLAKFIKFPPLTYNPLGGDPSPQPSIHGVIADQHFLVGELFTHALSNAPSNSKTPSIIGQIQKDGLHIEAMETVLEQFEKGTSAIKSELKSLKKC